MNNFRVLIPVALFLLLGLSSCQSSKNISKEYTSPACRDSLYLALQKKNPASFTLLEKNYYQKMKTLCGEEQANTREVNTVKTVVLAVMITGVVLAGLYFILLSNNKPH